MARSANEARFLPAAHQALEAFAVTPGEVTLAYHAENLTFRVVDGRDGAIYALRLHRPGYNSLEELESEFAWVQALAAAGIPTPSRGLTREGRPCAAIHVEGLEDRFASIARWVNGVTLSRLADTSPDRMEDGGHLGRLGALIARVHDQASAWRPPPHFKRRCWNVETLAGAMPVWGRFDRHPALAANERALLLSARDQARDALTDPALAGLGYSLIHGDLNLGNVMVDGDGLCLLDFDDAGFGHHLQDLATLLFHLHERPDYPRREQAFLQGYGSVRPLDDHSIALLPTFKLVRGLTLVGWFEQRPRLTSSDAFAALRRTVLAQSRRYLDAG